MRLKESELSKQIQEKIDDSPVKEVDGIKLEESRFSTNVERRIFDSQEEKVSDQEVKPISHTMVVEDLVKEVQIFSDEEDFLPDKKKGHKALWVFMILILLIILGVALFFYLKKDSREEEKDVEEPLIVHNYSYEELEDKIVFYDNEEEIDSYLCVDACSVYSLGRYQYFSKDNGVIALMDGENIFLYDFINKKEITDNFVRLENLFKEDETVAFIAADSLGQTGIIDSEGNIVIPFEYDNFGYSIGGGDVTDYSYEKNLITASKESHWGAITLDTGDEIIPFLYDDIYYNGYDAIAVLEEGLWYLLDLEGNQILEEGYDMIVPLNSYVIVAKDGNLEILNYKGERIINKDIPTYIIGVRGRSVSVIPTFKVEVDGTIVTIRIMKSTVDDTDYTTYKFNTVNGELTEVIS